jgi:hypothetical protein
MAYGGSRLGLAERGLYAVAGVCLFLPIGVFDAARTINLVGLALALALIAVEVIRRRLREPRVAGGE